MKLRQWIGIGGILLGSIGITSGIVKLVHPEKKVNITEGDFSGDNVPDFYLDINGKRKVLVRTDDGLDVTKFCDGGGSGYYILPSQDGNRVYFPLGRRYMEKLPGNKVRECT